MARYSVGGRATGAGSTTLPFASVYSPAGSGFVLREVSVYNTTVTAAVIRLVRLTTAGTPGAGLTEAEHWPDGPPPLATAFGLHTVAPTLGDELRRVGLGAAIGSGIIWTFSDLGIVVPSGVANGVGLIVATGTGQICDFDFTWDE